jgi:hypothetical protein
VGSQFSAIMQQQGPPSSPAGAPSITLSNMWKASLMDASMETFGINAGCHSNLGPFLI